MSFRRSVGPSVRPSVGPSVGPSVRNAFFSIGQKWVETNKNEISDDEAGRDYTSHDLFRVYELVKFPLLDRVMGDLSFLTVGGQVVIHHIL